MSVVIASDEVLWHHMMNPYASPRIVSDAPKVSVRGIIGHSALLYFGIMIGMHIAMGATIGVDGIKGRTLQYPVQMAATCFVVTIGAIVAVLCYRSFRGSCHKVRTFSVFVAGVVFAIAMFFTLTVLHKLAVYAFGTFAASDSTLPGGFGTASVV